LSGLKKTSDPQLRRAMLSDMRWFLAEANLSSQLKIGSIIEGDTEGCEG
jgi:hypothetical protein